MTTAREYVLYADDDPRPSDDCSACVVASPAGVRVAFDVSVSPPAARLLRRYVADIPLTDDDPNLPHCFYRRYRLIRAGAEAPDGACELLTLRFTPLPDDGVGVEWAFADGLADDEMQGAHTVMRLLAGMRPA